MDISRQVTLNFRETIPQKISSIYTRLGTIKDNIIEKLNPSNLDVKVRHFMEETQIAGLNALNNGKEFIETKVANYYLNKEERELEKREQIRLEQEELAREAEIAARTEEHKIGMKEALREQARAERQQRILNFKEGMKQRTSSILSNLGTVKNYLIEKMKSTKDKIVDFTSTKVANYYLNKEEKELERQEMERIKEEELAQEREIEARTEEHKIGMKEALREQEKAERKQRIIQFKQDAKQITSSIHAKLSTVRSDILKKIMPINLDVKIRNLLEESQIGGLNALNNGKEFIENKIANYYLNKADKELEKEELERIKAEEMAREAEIAARTQEHKIGMKEALREQDRMERQQRFINFKAGVKQQTSSIKSKLGTVKNALLEKLSNLKNKIVDYGSTKLANYYLKKEEKDNLKTFKEAAKLSEKQEVIKIRERIKQRKSDMKFALREQEREMYEQKHIENMAKKEELMASVFGTPEVYEESEPVRTL